MEHKKALIQSTYYHRSNIDNNDPRAYLAQEIRNELFLCNLCKGCVRATASVLSPLS